MRIVDAQLVARFENRIINTHPALLPSFPGAHGVRDALAHGVKITGLTVHFVDSGVDTGTIIAQAAVPVEDGDTEESLHERIKVQERQLLVRTLAEFAALPKLKPPRTPARRCRIPVHAGSINTPPWGTTHSPSKKQRSN